MREIMFRGIALKDHDTGNDGLEKGDWVVGHYYYCYRRMSAIIVTQMLMESGGVGSGLVQVEVEVDIETCSQYTGLKDKNGTEIYEGEILELTNCATENPIHFTVFFSQPSASFRLRQISDQRKYSNRIIPFKSCIVIGNIYENPDLVIDVDKE